MAITYKLLHTIIVRYYTVNIQNLTTCSLRYETK
uniref:Uncharacterized protein n=1 Tax=Anguilla anguilla TaxID=7936 RepID=A0A0E9WVS2_ANGAN